MSKELPRRSTGIKSDLKDGYVRPGVADVSPAAGYNTVAPVQYSDETDEQFSQRVAMFESAKANAEALEDGTFNSVENQLKALDARYDAEKAVIEASREEKYHADATAGEEESKKKSK
jgi:hypothetical protein